MGNQRHFFKVLAVFYRGISKFSLIFIWFETIFKMYRI